MCSVKFCLQKLLLISLLEKLFLLQKKKIHLYIQNYQDSREQQKKTEQKQKSKTEKKKRQKKQRAKRKIKEQIN